MALKYSKVSGWGKYTPDKVLSNADLEQMVNTSDEWITTRTGIKERRIAADDETCSTMAVQAAQQALATAKLKATELDLIIVATSSPDYLVPIVSSTIQYKLGAACPAFTLVTGCTGFVYGLATAHQFIASGAYENVLLIGVELISRFVDWTDRNTCVLFGDAAAAFILSSSTTPTGVKAFDLGSDGEKGMVLALPGLGTAQRMDQAMIERGDQYLKMNGREVFKFATRVVPQSTLKVLENAGMTLDDIDFFIPHQANARIIDSAARRLGIPDEKVYINVDRYGNTSAASIPLAIIEALEAGKIYDGDHLCLVSFGGGLTWASALLQWGQPLDSGEAKADETLIWDISTICKRLMFVASRMKLKARTMTEALQQRVATLLLPLYAVSGHKTVEKKTKK